MEKRTITIQTLEEKKRGTNGKGPWVLTKVQDTNGKWYSTFLKDLVEGETYDFLIEVEKDGKYTNYTIKGFDKDSYEGKKERPAQPSVVYAKDENIGKGNSLGFTAEDRRKLDAIYDTIIGGFRPLDDRDE